MTRGLRAALLAGLVFAIAALAGCADPEKSAQAAITKAEAAWTEARAELDPKGRVKRYDAVIKDVETIGKKYKKSAAAKTIAAGGTVGGVSLTAMKATRDDLAARAECYAAPTAECLKPFASRSFSENAAYQSSPEAAFGTSQQLVCEKGFAAADATLEPFKINRPIYAQQLMQIGMAAAACDRPEDLKAAIDAYRAAEPAQDAERRAAMLTILATDALEPAWPPVLAEFETALASGALDANSAANVALTLATRYAALGQTQEALAKYDYFKQLGYEADWQSKLDLATGLVMAGAAEQGLLITATGDQKSFLIIPLNQAAAEIGRRLKLIRQGSHVPELTTVQDVAVYMAQADAAEKARYGPAAAAVEAEIDKLAPSVVVQDGAFGPSGLDSAYGMLALAWQKLGEPAKATAAMDKALALRAAKIPEGAVGVGEDAMAEYQAVLALAQGKPEEAATHAKLLRVRHDHARLIMNAMAQAGDAEKALTVAGELGAGPNFATYSPLVEGLVKAGKTAAAEAVIAAYPGSAEEKAGLNWMLINQLADAGDARGAEAAAAKYGLLKTAADRLRLKTVLLNSEKILKDRKQAEPIIREIFAIGEEMDKAYPESGGHEQFLAQTAASFAFKAGYTDLGVELYQKASRKDQRPLFDAFQEGADPKSLTPVLMLAQDNLTGEERAYVIDAAIRAGVVRSGTARRRRVRSPRRRAIPPDTARQKDEAASPCRAEAPAGEHVGRVMDAEEHPARSDEEREDSGGSEKISAGASVLEQRRCGDGEIEIDRGGACRMAAREACAGDFREVRNDLRARTIEQRFQKVDDQRLADDDDDEKRRIRPFAPQE